MVEAEKWWQIFEVIDNVISISDIIDGKTRINNENIRKVNENLIAKNITTENENVYFSFIGGVYGGGWSTYVVGGIAPIIKKEPFLKVLLEIRNEKPISEENLDYTDEVVNIKRWDFKNEEVNLTLDEWKNYKRTSLVDKMLEKHDEMLDEENRKNIM